MSGNTDNKPKRDLFWVRFMIYGAVFVLTHNFFVSP